jgi:hypothetical protein
MKRVLIESPYAGDVARNLRYVRACMRDAFLRGEAPFASHALYTQPGVLRDDVPRERNLGIVAGFAWRAAAELTAVYEDLGVSDGMKLGISHARETSVPIENRTVGHAWEAESDGADVVASVAEATERAAQIAESDGSSTGRAIAERIRRGDS